MPMNLRMPIFLGNLNSKGIYITHTSMTIQRELGFLRCYKSRYYVVIMSMYYVMLHELPCIYVFVASLTPCIITFTL